MGDHAAKTKAKSPPIDGGARVQFRAVHNSEYRPALRAILKGWAPGGAAVGRAESPSRLQIQRMSSDRVQNVEAPLSVRQVLRTPGRALDQATRSFMEGRFGYDFSAVRVHTSAEAAASAQAIDATAYTAGNDVVFGAGKTPGKDTLTAHELTHVVQQNTGARASTETASARSAPLIQRQCVASVGSPAAYASAAAPHLRCDEPNTGIADVTARLTAGRQRARAMINDALTVLNSMLTNRAASPDALRHFRRLFRLSAPQPTNGQIRFAISIYNQICTWLTSPIAIGGGGIICLTQGTGNCRSGRWAGLADCGAMRPIYLCPGGISDNSQATAETIIHEAAHRFGVCTRPPPGSAPGTPAPPERYQGQPGFPTTPALQTSADSYNFFAREARSLMGRERRQAQERREAAEGMTEMPAPRLRGPH